MKKCCVFVLVVVLVVVSCVTPIVATEVYAEEHNQTFYAMDVPVLVIPDTFSEEDAIAYVEENGAKGIVINGWATYAVVRTSSSSERCRLIINWSGELASAFRCKMVQIKSTKFINPIVYDQSGNGVSYTVTSFVASTLASVTHGFYDIPIDVEKVTVSVSSGQMYLNARGSWVSAAKPDYTTDIEN